MMSGNKELEIDSEIEYVPIINHQLELKNKTRITFIFLESMPQWAEDPLESHLLMIHTCR